MSNAKVIVITGPCGVGKTTLTTMIAHQLGGLRISGDEIKHALFPEIADITDHPEKLKFIKDLLFNKSKINFENGHTVIIDYVILGREYIARFQQEFKEDLLFWVLLPSKAVIYARDERRACWSSGRTVIDSLYEKYLELIPLIGEANYIDNGGETPEESVKKVVELVRQKT